MNIIQEKPIRIQDISNNIDLLNESLQWADNFKEETFPRETIKNARWEVRKIKESLSENCSAAAYGESQVGKSYLMSSLLSSPEHPFVIMNEGKAYSFIDEINPSGGNNTKKESTGVITRFTIRQTNVDPNVQNYIKVKLLSVVDIILLLADSYYNDTKINPNSVLLHDQINRILAEKASEWMDKTYKKYYITEDDIKDIQKYFEKILNQANISRSKFHEIIAPIIEHIPTDKWVDVFGLLWNKRPEINRLFNNLINEYKKLDFQSDVYIPFNAVLRDKGTLLNIEWLDTVCGTRNPAQGEEPYTEIYDTEGNLICENFNKGYLSALCSEITFVLPKEIAKERSFLNKIDLLDFPGARSRGEYTEEELGEVLPQILRRGKVAYLFNKYSRSGKIAAVLYCHHNDQKTEGTICNTISDWIDDNIGKTPEERAAMQNNTNGIAPLFMIGTKFNIELEKTKIDTPDQPEKLDKHWARFDTVIPEIIEPKKWMDKWVPKGGTNASEAFRNIYLLRDFYYSAKNQVFDGYDEKKGTIEIKAHEYSDYPDFLKALEQSFLKNEFVQKHFANPQQAWNDVAEINNDGSKAIIYNLGLISEYLDGARREKFLNRLQKLQDNIIKEFETRCDAKDKEDLNRQIMTIAGDLKLDLAVIMGDAPEKFGRIIDSLMISSGELRDIAYDILERHIDVPKEVSVIKIIRAECGIVPNTEENENKEKLQRRYKKDINSLDEYFKKKYDFSVDDVINDNSSLLATTEDVITEHIIKYWFAHLNRQAKKLSDVLPHAEKIVLMLMTSLKNLGVKKIISDKISIYSTVFNKAELPNAIADFAALKLNNFVSTAGREYMSAEDIETIKNKAASCDTEVDFSYDGCNVSVKPQPLMEVLKTFDESGVIINQDSIDMAKLRKLPLWDNYQRWENLIIIGLLYANELSRLTPEANNAMLKIIDNYQKLYK